MVINFYLVVMIINVPGQQVAAPPVVQTEQLVQEHEPGLLHWHCPHCNWFNAYQSASSLKNGSKQHLRRRHNK